MIDDLLSFWDHNLKCNLLLANNRIQIITGCKRYLAEMLSITRRMYGIFVVSEIHS